MIIYGYPSYAAAHEELLARLRERVRRLQSSPNAGDLRGILIEAGQLEQAVADSADAVPEVARSTRATDLAGQAFCRAWSATGPAVEGLAATLVELARELAAPSRVPAARLRVRLPDGFATQALFPEQYAAAARRWVADRGAGGAARAIVVGVRSIGTSLSAVVAATLESEGWSVARATVRPTGNPSDRRAQLEPGAAAGADWGLVVDEGPGPSGSSMAAVADALVAAGVGPHRIVFMPGGSRDPGPDGPAAARAWWAGAPRLVVATTEPLWDGRPLAEAVAARAGAIDRPEDLGAGLWRGYRYRRRSGWPAAFAPFERPKYLARSLAGAILLKFEGLAVDAGPAGSLALAAADRQGRLAVQGWTTDPLGVHDGFVVSAWLEAAPLRRTDLSSGLVERVGCYVAASAGPPLSESDSLAGIERLGEMLFQNTREALGDARADRTRAWLGAALGAWAPGPSYGDGRMAPHEWLARSSDRVMKVDVTGHDRDRTVVGGQSVAWDLAGALVEWDLEPARERALLRAHRLAGGEDPPAAQLDFHRLAYAAYRMGLASLCADASLHDPDEAARLRRAAAGYRATLERLLAGPGPRC